MSKTHLEWKVGLFVFVGLALLAGLLLQFSKGTTFFHSTYRILLRTVTVGDLKPRASVLMAGVQVGTVSDIKLGPQGTNVTITLKIYSEYEIHKDVRFQIEQSGFLGDKYVAIVPTKNQGDVFKDEDVAEAEAPFNMLEVARSVQDVARSAGGFVARIDDTAVRLNEAIADVRRLVLNDQTLTNISTAVVNFRGVSEHALTTVDNVNTLVQSNSPSIELAVSNLKLFSEEINRFATEFSSVLTSNTAEITVAVKNIESSTVTLTNLLHDLETQKGLAGRLIKNEDLAASVSQIASNLTITTSNLNRLGLWGILWSHKSPRTNAPPRALSSPKDRSE
jgi:ABC-type transporter Mla subunit MlaD